MIYPTIIKTRTLVSTQGGLNTMDTVDDLMQWHFGRSCPHTLLSTMNGGSMDRPTASNVHGYRGLPFERPQWLISEVPISGPAYDRTSSARLRFDSPHSYVGAIERPTGSGILDAASSATIRFQITNHQMHNKSSWARWAGASPSRSGR